MVLEEIIGKWLTGTDTTMMIALLAGDGEEAEIR